MRPCFRVFVVSIFWLSALSGCASTSVTAFKDPEFANARFERIAVYANTLNLEWRSSLEQGMAEEVIAQGGSAIPSMLIIPPTANQSAEEAVQALIDNNVSAVLQIDIGDSGVQEQWIPQTGSTTTTTGTASVYGNTGVYSGSSHTTNYGGYNVNKPWANMQTRLFDVESGKTVWIASSSTGGNAYADWDDIRSSYCKKIASEMVKSNIW